MLSIEIKKPYKSIPAGAAFELPSFTVITGKNGSGKSHFLEALANVNHASIKANGGILSIRQLVEFGELSAKTGHNHDPNHVDEQKQRLWKEVQNVKRGINQVKPQNVSLNDYASLKINDGLFAKYRDGAALIQAAAADGKKIDEFEKNDIDRFEYRNFLSSDKSLFSASLAQIFNKYNVKFLDNEFRNFLYEKGSAPDPGLTNVEFEKRFGPKPWDLVNEILLRADLAYQVVPPTFDNHKLPYQLKLIDAETDKKIWAEDLSTGEKVLLALGIAIFRTQEDAGKPDVLLLDEPDAALHPEFSLLLVEILRDVIVAKAGVSVIMTTHSPSTLALCPNDAIFEMDRETGRPRSIPREKGMRILTSGIPHLRVSTEPRRQIFVESKYDVIFFERLFNALNRFSRFQYEPVFLQPHSGTSSCTDVIKIVTNLNEAGSDLVRGIVDWDKTNTTGNSVFVLGAEKRYAIENYILDPLFVALALIKARKSKFSDFGITDKVTYLEAVDLNEKEAQALANGVLSMAGISLNDSIKNALLNGWSTTRPREFLEMKGHSWERVLIEKIPALNELTRGRTEDDKLKTPILDVIEEVPLFLPVELRKTLEDLY
jgi:predicted ATPase